MKTRSLIAGAASLAIALAGVYGCSDDEPAATSSKKDAGTKKDATATGDSSTLTAKADIKPTSDASTVTGTATFTEANGQVTVTVNVTGGFPPGQAGQHGMHIHAGASCDANDAGANGATLYGGAAGGHWNPADAGHGYPTAAVHHRGDMGNIVIDATGTGTLTLSSSEWTVAPGEKSVVGHALVFHSQQDDGVTQPVGDAGARPGCGIITVQSRTSAR